MGSLVAWYRLNDALASLLVEDASGNGYHATAARNTSDTSVVGKLGNAYSSNGSSDYISYAWTLTNAVWTFAFWIKPASVSAFSRAVIFNGSTHFYCGVQIANSGLAQAIVGASGTSVTHRDTTTSLSTTAWWHVAAVIKPAVPDFTVYLNGSLNQGSIVGSGAAGYNPTTLDIARLRYAGTLYYSQQLMDDVRVYNEELTAAQIAAIYNGSMGSSRPYPWNPQITRPTIRPTVLRTA